MAGERFQAVRARVLFVGSQFWGLGLCVCFARTMSQAAVAPSKTISLAHIKVSTAPVVPPAPVKR